MVMLRVRAPVCSAADSAFQWCLEVPPPASVPVGGGSAVHLAGWCFHRDAPIRELRFAAGGKITAALAHSLPRPDVRAAMYPEHDRRDHSYASGFYAVIPLPGVSSSEQLKLLAQIDLATGRTEEHLVDVITLTPSGDISPLSPGAGQSVVVAMATYNPQYELFARQIDSLARQTYGDWRCLISDDRSNPEIFDRIRQLLEGDGRFIIDRSHLHLGAYHNFERALALVSKDTPYVALADQDDHWYPEKLETLLAAFDSETTLAYSDCRLVRPEGTVLAETFFVRRPNNSNDLYKMLLANTVTGASSLFRTTLLNDVLPFPPILDPLVSFHDHWVAVVALSLGRLAYVDAPLYDYVQHQENVLGHAVGQVEEGGYRGPWLLRSRASYQSTLIRTLLMATALDQRLHGRISTAHVRGVRDLTNLEHSPQAIARMAIHALTSPRGRSTTEGTERDLLSALAWRRRMLVSARRRNRFVHPWYSAAPEITDGKVPPGNVQGVQRLSDAIAALPWEIHEAEPPRVNLLMRRLELDDVLDNDVGRLSLAVSLSAAGVDTRVIVWGGLPIPTAEIWDRLEAAPGTPRSDQRPELVSSHSPLRVSRSDVFIACDWSTAHAAHHGTVRLGRNRFLYLIDEYAGAGSVPSLRVEAERSYRLPHCALFWNHRLDAFFRARRLGVFSGPLEAAQSATTAAAITPAHARPLPDVRGRTPSRLLLHAPEDPDSVGNLLDLGVLVLDRAADAGLLAGWEVNSIGTPLPRPIRLGPTLDVVALDPVGREAYADVLHAHDVAMTLAPAGRFTSVALEMAAAGLPTIMIAIDSDDQRWVEANCPNLIPVQPFSEDVARGLVTALERVADSAQRLSGVPPDQPTAWLDTFNPAAVERILKLLAICAKPGESKPLAALRRLRHALAE
jgi:glycosyl transferase family 2/beta-1,2-rhamnosyltransferase WsaF-like protein